MKALDRKLMRDLWHLRGQIAAIALVVACGVAAFVSMRGIYRSLLASQRSYYASYRFADVFAHLKRAPAWLAPRLGEIPGVGAVRTRIVAEVTLDVPGLAEPATGRLVAIPERRAPMLNDLHMLRGRYLEAGQRDEVILSASFAEKNGFQPGATLSAIINGRWTRLRVVGIALSPEYVYEISPGAMLPDPRRFGILWMSEDALAAAFDMKGAFNDVALAFSPGAREAEIIERLDALLARYGSLGAYGRADQTSHMFIDNELGELRVNGTFIPAVFLTITAFLIHLVLSRLVNTQREQIAVLKAFGYGNRPIGLHFLKLALAAVLFGTALGIAFGWWFGRQMTALYAEFFRFPVMRYELDPLVLGSAVFISLLAASVGVISAVRHAVALPPAEAMRPEPPARFRLGLAERLGLQRALPLAARIILRNLERHPIKALLTSFGIAMAVSLLVVGHYFYDAIDQVIALQFGAVFREDANVAFNENRPLRARHDLAGLPGVLRVEAYRFVPVRLRYEHRRRRVGLLGMEPSGELQRVVDMNFNVIPIPAEGVVLSARLADILAVKPGDTLTIEVLEGAKPVRQAAVVAVADEVMGLSAYMSLPALNRLLREEGAMSGARLLLDAPQAETLYARLKRMPVVGSVLVPAALLDNFNATLSRTLGMFTSLIIAFGCIIVFGMVYNGARIALSERGRELASLRVLGFTKAEVGLMLLGEQALLTLLAIPAGFGLGYFLCWLIVHSLHTDLMRLPLFLSNRTYALSLLITLGAAALSALLVQWRVRRLDLIAVLKTRE